MKFPGFILLVMLASCSFNTDISYRKHRHEQYIKEDGFLLSCTKSGNYLIVGAYTPYSCDKAFYYDFLSGMKTTRNFTITVVDVHFINTADTLTLQKVRDKRNYFYTSPNLDRILAANKKLRLTVYLKDTETGVIETKEFILNRRKHTYPTSTLPHVL